MQKGYANPYWMTFKQAQALKCSVRRGEHGEHIVYAARAIKREIDDQGNETVTSFPFLKSYVVFNVEQIDGPLPEKYRPASNSSGLPESERIQAAEAWAKSTGADIRHGGAAAFYVPSMDYVQMPEFQKFRHALGYYGTLAHELTHWTGAKDRLAREFGKRFGDSAYAVEELVAGLGRHLSRQDLAWKTNPAAITQAIWRPGCASCKSDKRAIFTAASMAQKAADYLMA